MDAVLGRRVLDHVTAHREQFDMAFFGMDQACGTVACLAGHAMLLSGYAFRDSDTMPCFLRPDGSPVADESGEAQELLSLTDDEYYGDGFEPATLFGPQAEEYAIERFRLLVEAAEAEARHG